jgi:lipid kinase YegS
LPDETVLVLHRKSANEAAIQKAIKTVRKEGLDFRVLVPFNKAEKPRIVAEALERGATRIIAGGGDGTVNAVANALIGDASVKPDVTLGVCPLGTANDFARGCGLPTDDLAECLRIACTREGREIDVGVLNGRHFINVASAGFGAEITATTPIQLKKALGGAAYTLMGMIKAMNLTPYPGRLVIPGRETVADSMLFMAVGNNHFAGGGFDVAPLSKLDDGLLDLVGIRADRGLRLAGIGREWKDPMNPNNQYVFYAQLSEFAIESDTKLHCNLDGEPIHKKKLKFSILPRQLRVAF